jgi:hypothetical protein
MNSTAAVNGQVLPAAAMLTIGLYVYAFAALPTTW